MAWPTSAVSGSVNVGFMLRARSNSFAASAFWPTACSAMPVRCTGRGSFDAMACIFLNVCSAAAGCCRLSCAVPSSRYACRDFGWAAMIFSIDSIAAAGLADSRFI